MKKILLLAAIAAAAWFLNRDPATVPDSAPPQDAAEAMPDRIAAAFAGRRSDVAVTGSGRVSRLLGDDSLGDRHQRFILALDSGQSLLVAHNIDIAPRVESLAVGDTVEFRGVYEWNDKGGVVHWTHHDPEGRHEAGWIRHRGRTYE